MDSNITLLNYKYNFPKKYPTCYKNYEKSDYKYFKYSV